MAIKCIFIDFYGTLVYENEANVKNICKLISQTSPQPITPSDVAGFWWDVTNEVLMSSTDERFISQEDMDRRVLYHVIKSFESKSNRSDLYTKLTDGVLTPGSYQDGRIFLSNLPIPVCLLANGDRNLLESALKYTQISVPYMVCSEDAQSYKPGTHIYEYAYKKMGFAPDECLMVGDSMHYDITPAAMVGMRTAWLNRTGRVMKGSTRPDLILDSLMVLRNMITKDVKKSYE